MPNYNQIGIDYEADNWYFDGDTFPFPVVGTDFRKIINRKEIVILAHTITIEYDYPLSNKARYTHRRNGGWTREALARAIRTDYRRIYRQDHKFGIWGHDISDLVIEGVEYDREKRLVTLIIGS